MADIEDRVERFRAFREAIEATILPLATSVDGRRFEFQASLHGLELQAGGYVVLEDADGRRLGQVLSLALVSEEGTSLNQGSADDAAVRTHSRVLVRLARGSGTILESDGRPFHDALARPATPDEVGAWLARSRSARAQLAVGELVLAPGVPCALDAGGFGRHTFLCGQSGSGKTYALGVVLERLLLETELRIVVLDPNSDYVRLADTRPDAEAAAYAEAARGVAVRGGESGLRLRIRDLDPDQQAALLRLDPIGDREEYAELTDVVARQHPGSMLELGASEQAHRLSLRVRNLGVDRWTLWSRAEGGSLVDDLGAPDARCLVVDLGSLPTREEQALAAGAVLRALWRRRAERQPVLVVIDEAHNVCPQHSDDALTALAAQDAIRIAGEGRKYGLYLLLATQRPQKLHENVLSQCDNLLLMRMNSAADLAVVGAAFSFVAPGLLERATAFRQGEAIAAGPIASHPEFIRFGARISHEGGADVAATWAQPR